MLQASGDDGRIEERKVPEKGGLSVQRRKKGEDAYLLIEIGVEGTRPVMGGRRRTSHINTTEPLVMELQKRGPGFECESGETTRSGAVVDG
jgi:hypothetical protein